MTEEKFINVNELQNKTSEIIRGLEKGKNYVVLRYSDPVGVLISYQDYKKLQNLESDFVHQCKQCLGIAKTKETKAKKKEIIK